jgi:hypothetical protein
MNPASERGPSLPLGMTSGACRRRNPDNGHKVEMKTFIKQLFSESSGASFSRVGSFLALISSLGWLSYIVWETRAVPSLEGLTIFICSLYALGKTGETIQRVMGGSKEKGEV